ncbi:MAG: hypothetical protein K6U12_06420 [Armatimonadetes bacterium]|nr:hypothetical protein [Armatimonadota bacterium]
MRGKPENGQATDTRGVCARRLKPFKTQSTSVGSLSQRGQALPTALSAQAGVLRPQPDKGCKWEK